MIGICELYPLVSSLNGCRVVSLPRGMLVIKHTTPIFSGILTEGCTARCFYVDSRMLLSLLVQNTSTFLLLSCFMSVTTRTRKEILFAGLKKRCLKPLTHSAPSVVEVVGCIGATPCSLKVYSSPSLRPSTDLPSG